MAVIRSVCVFCGSRSGDDPSFARSAKRLGAALGGRGIRTVFGGGRVGLMGIVADAALAAGGEVIGVIPAQIETLEVAHRGVTELRRVTSMYERKQMMFDLSDAFVILPGALGTLDEAFEALTARQLRFIAKPIVVVNEDGYWQQLVELIEHIVARGFADASARQLFTVVAAVDDVLPALDAEPAAAHAGEMSAGE